MGLLMKCVNCTKDGFYIYQLTAKTQVIYCNTHLPKFLEQAKSAGLLKTTDSFKSVMEEGLKKITSNSKPLEVEETPTEEPVLEIEPTPTPTPPKKSAKKSATKNANNS